MKKRLDHLPTGKRHELRFVVEVVREGFAAAVAHRTAPRFREGRILKIILFGSYARGDWVEDPVGRYFSDYDLLVVVTHEDLADPGEFWLATEERLLAELASGERLRTPVSLIVHSMDDVNEKLRLGRYFFMDILREGIVLFEEPDHPFVNPEPLPPAAALKEAQEYYEEWLESAEQFYRQYRHAVADGAPKVAAFDLHQTAERLYHCYFLVLTLYSPKTHNLNRLRALAEGMDARLKEVWPSATKFERRCYELIRAAYVKARYSRHYKITAEELEWLGGRIDQLRNLVRTLCEERLEALAREAG
ncbi:HEPN domain-containing protein [Phenylobacterium sp.]|uniref:HEPN domain-containing protein n=1 Tax=Phenylobacterium sp. TaxID=1871053 RepID=UPI0035AEB874